jgi:adenylyl- and sulfurtransferase ThiI
MSRKAGKTQLELLIKVTKARLPARQTFVANMLGNVRQLLRDLPLDRPLIEYTDEEIIALVRRIFRERSAKRDSRVNRSIGRRKRKR